MAQEEVIGTIRRYLSVLQAHGIAARRAVLFGSWARGQQRADSDIDILVVSPAFDEAASDRVRLEGELWGLTPEVDPRLQPIGVGEKQYATDDVLPILEIARREGIEIEAEVPSRAQGA